MKFERQLIMDKGYKMAKKVGTERAEKTNVSRINKIKHNDRNTNKISNLEKTDMKNEDDRE